MQIDQKWIIRIGAAVVAVAVLAIAVRFVFGLLSTLLPVAVAGGLLYLGYRWYTHRQPVREGETITISKDNVREKEKKPAPATETKAVEVEIDEDNPATTWDKKDFTATVDRLAEKEREAQQRKTDVDPDALRAQLEERKRRLGL